MLVPEPDIVQLRRLWSIFPGYEPNSFKAVLDTLEVLWKIARAGQEHCRTHGHTSDVSLEEALIEAGLSDPALAAWRKKKKS
jgi:hypothetical protein